MRMVLVHTHTLLPAFSIKYNPTCMNTVCYKISDMRIGFGALIRDLHLDQHQPNDWSSSCLC